MFTKLLCLALTVFCAASAAPDSRIVGGTPVPIQEFPSVIAVVYHYPRPNIYIQRCVGCLISSWHVLTTAFCFTGGNVNNVRIRAGSADSLSGGQLTTVRALTVHPDYDEATRRADLAVLLVHRPFGISNTVRNAFLPTAFTFLPDGLETRVASWGFETEDGPQHPNLRAITLRTVNLQQCKQAFEAVDDIDIDDGMLCAANEGVGTCFGDSGAPMLLNNVVIGVASYYRECGGSAYPEVFTRVDRFTNWIVSVAVAPSGETPLRRAVVY